MIVEILSIIYIYCYKILKTLYVCYKGVSLMGLT